MYIVVIGGGNVGVQLAKRLLSRGHEVVLMEKLSDRARKLERLVGEQNVLIGDGCDLAAQKEAGFNRADVVVAVTGEDEDNLIACQLAKEAWNVSQVVARVNDPSHETIFRELGIDETVSATGIIFNLIEQQIGGRDLVPVGALHKGQMEVVESTVSQRSPLIGRAVRDIQLPAGSLLVYAVRGAVGMAVNGDTVLQAGDMVVALVPTSEAESLKAVLCSRTMDA
jgi:trk system potassium uptake protein TrkA